MQFVDIIQADIFCTQYLIAKCYRKGRNMQTKSCLF
jgi:hypothetical protein